MFLVPEENRMKIDLHGLDIEMATYYLEEAMEDAQEDIQAIVVIHGYNHSKILDNLYENFIRRPIFKKCALKMERTINPGISIIYLKEYNLRKLKETNQKKVKKKEYKKKGE